MTPLPSPNAFRDALGARTPIVIPALPGRTNHLNAGILVPLRWLDDEIEVILTERAAHLSNHPGEICFPGGRSEEGDENARATALREAEEEIGLHGAEVLGELSSIPLYTSDYRLHPYVACVPNNAQLTLQESEVASLVKFGIRELLDTKLYGIPWEHEGREHVSPIFEAPTKLVFGGTAHALWELLEVVAPLFETKVPKLITGKYTWGDVLLKK